MDSYREHSNDFDLPASDSAPGADDVAAAIGTDERRMHVRAYNYWVSLLDGRDFPSIEDLEPGDVQDFAPNSVLLDFTCGKDNPAVPYIGGAIRDECGLDDGTRTIADVPSRSLLSRLTDHYMQIIANRAPVGFEAEFENQRDESICYRGILMPFSSDGDTIDFIYGVINWKTVGEEAAAATAEAEPLELVADDIVPMVEPETEAATAAIEGIDLPDEEPVAEEREWEEPTTDPETELPPIELVVPEPQPIHSAWEDGPLADADEDAIPEIALDEDAGLADRLWAARETAEAVKSADGRTRAALYRALSLAYDFSIAADRNPEDYAELLEESGVKAQARAPMTPIVKLVFGIDYDKARLTEFAAALSYAQRQQIALGGFQSYIETQPGGLKAMVAAERGARRPEPRADTRGDAARAKLRAAPAIDLSEIASDEEFSVVITRRRADGGHEAVAVIDDAALIDRAIRKAV